MEGSSLRTPSLWERLTGLVQIIRLHVCLQGAVVTLVGTYLGGGLGEALSRRALKAALVMSTIIAFGYVVNDYKDVAVDSLSKPQRAIPSGRISRPMAGMLALGLGLGALGVACTIDLWLASIALALIVISASYSCFLKGTLLLGNLTMGFLNATLILYGGWAANCSSFATWIIGLAIFLFTCAQEILFAVRDRRGDALVGLRTTAVCLGTKGALSLFRAFAMAFVLTIILPWLLHLAPSLYLYAVLLFSVVPVAYNIITLRPTATDAEVRQACRLMRLARALSILALIPLRW